ncbi:MAG: helix-turn-helix domain-containing protein [Clostridiales bacterium]|jgi:carbohydrate diacid regulator|nr:helix-turn-helix domain-containing protein [Clostridiales bacterium]
MISNQILQNAIDGLKNITHTNISIIERDGKLIASTENLIPYDYQPVMENFIHSPADTQQIQSNQFFKVYDNGVAEYAVVIHGEDDYAYRVGKIAAFHIQGLLIAYKERYDRDNFVKNLLLDNLLLVDIYNRAKKLHVENNVRRVVYLIETEIDKEMSAVEIVRGIFPAKQRDFVTAVDESSIILVKELREKEASEDIEKYARIICDTLGSEAMSKVTVAIGTVVSDLKNVSSSYKEARMAQEVGKIFEPDRQIVNYEQLGIGRLIYQLPLSLCRIFIKEVLHGVNMTQFDDETLATVSKFFENHLNVSETSRQLYIHRNTLVYRLDKLQKLTGLDLRNFNDAITFKITLMVSRYMQYKERHSF